MSKKSIIQELREAQASIDRALTMIHEIVGVKRDYDSHIDWSKILARYDAPVSDMVDKAAAEVKESFRRYDLAKPGSESTGRAVMVDGELKELFRDSAPTWNTKGYQEAVERAREAHFATLRRNGIDTPVADCNDPYGIKDLGKLSFDELYLLMEREDRPGPRRDAIASAMQTAGKTPIEDTDGDARWAAKRAHERGAPPADDPRPRSETIIVKDKHVTPLREERGLFGWRRPADDPGAGVFFERGPWWWPF